LPLRKNLRAIGYLARIVDQGYGWRRITYRPYRFSSVEAGLGTRQFAHSRGENRSEALPATGLIIPGTHSSKGAAGKIIIRDGSAAGGTVTGLVDERIASSVAAVRVGAGLKKQGRQYEQHQSFYHVIFLPG